ncbi:MAG TPA: glycine zipper 2TM domain-containing protein [Frateuria sp.]|uniref:glycine zipper 2TM domain-containing protein n=1 Tax=Frateuria sp. TaxID=2211372 RepID=UPI002DEE7D4E|nr:glycine zipper 2TM domain-containing protein [Frateuria sp.]
MKAILVLLAAALAFATAPMAQAQSSYARSGVLVRSDGIYVRCDQCGTVQSIEHTVNQGSGHGTAGAVIGAIAGGVLGNQIGRGKGRELATVGGAVGGGFAGHAIGNRTGNGNDAWIVHLKMGNGTTTSVQVADATGIREGDIVQVDAQGNITRVR